MRRSVSFPLVLAAAVTVAGGARAAGGPGSVYSDYVQDGKLSCNHSRGDLIAALRSSTLNQYGDPYALAGMKLAVRKQLAGGCSRSQQGGTTGAPGPATTTGTSKQRDRHRKSARGGVRPRTVSPQSRREASVGGTSGAFIAGRLLILLGLVAILGIGGWLTKRALAARE